MRDGRVPDILVQAAIDIKRCVNEPPYSDWKDSRPEVNRVLAEMYALMIFLTSSQPQRMAREETHPSAGPIASAIIIARADALKRDGDRRPMADIMAGIDVSGDGVAELLAMME